MFFTILLFFVGFFILIKGANFLVDGASSLARRFRISNMVIGLLIVGIGTSIPEFAISFLANFLGKTDIGLGTIIGSNTFNILFILGLSAFLFPLRLKESWVYGDLIWNISAVLVPALPLALYSFGNGGAGLEIPRLAGFVMLWTFGVWVYLTVVNSKEDGDVEVEPLRVLALPLSWGMILGGLVGVILGGRWVVDGTVLIAKELGMSEVLLGLTVVGIGTSLPELVVSVVAAYKKLPGIAVGNIIGSNVFDFLMILGIGALANPIVLPQKFLLDIAVTFFSSLLLLVFMFTGERYTLKRLEGFLFMVLYVLYMIFLINRG